MRVARPQGVCVEDLWSGGTLVLMLGDSNSREVSKVVEKKEA